MFALENVSIERHGRCVLQDAELIMSTGELVAIVGPNGAGKSTLLQTLTGELAPKTGRATLNGRRLQDWDLQRMACLRAVYSQADHLTFPFTVREVILLGRMPQPRRSTAEDHAVVRQAMQLTDVTHFARRRYTELSGGERSRVRLARALAQVWPTAEAPRQKHYLLLDEPLAALDLHYQYHMLEILKERVGPHLGVLIVMHDLGLAARYADRVVLVDAGRIVAEGPARQVLTAERLSQHYRLPMQVLDVPQIAHPIITAGNTDRFATQTAA